MAALRIRGLMVVGSVDHDSAAGAGEMAAAADAGLGSVTGFECRVYLYSADEVAEGRAPLHDRKLNNPDTAGIAYMTVQGIRRRSGGGSPNIWRPSGPPASRGRRGWSAGQRDPRGPRGARAGLPARRRRPVAVLKRRRGDRAAPARGNRRQTHRALRSRPGSLVDGLGELGLKLSEKVAAQLGDEANPYLEFDLLGVMKAGFLDQIYLVPGREECPAMAEVAAFATSVGAIPAYAYLGDVTASPTNDKKAEKFEDDFLDELVAELRRLGIPPSRTCRRATPRSRWRDSRRSPPTTASSRSRRRHQHPAPTVQLPGAAAPGAGAPERRDVGDGRAQTARRGRPRPRSVRRGRPAGVVPLAERIRRYSARSGGRSWPVPAPSARPPKP